jgi:hypothetical protein
MVNYFTKQKARPGVMLGRAEGLSAMILTE